MNVEKMTVNQINSVYEDFKGMLLPYVEEHGDTLDLGILRVTLKITTLNEIHKTIFMTYALKYWYAYTMDIIEGKYECINCTTMMWNLFCYYMVR